MIYEIKNGEKKGTALYSGKHIYLYKTVIPEGLCRAFNTTKEAILLHHTSAAKVLNVRKVPDEKRLEKELKKFLKE